MRKPPVIFRFDSCEHFQEKCWEGYTEDRPFSLSLLYLNIFVRPRLVLCPSSRDVSVLWVNLGDSQYLAGGKPERR